MKEHKTLNKVNTGRLP